jgi:hypothetical protein
MVLLVCLSLNHVLFGLVKVCLVFIFLYLYMHVQSYGSLYHVIYYVCLILYFVYLRYILLQAKIVLQECTPHGMGRDMVPQVSKFSFFIGIIHFFWYKLQSIIHIFISIILVFVPK